MRMRARADPPVFSDRRDAGRQLAAVLAHLAPTEPVVVGLPRGGVPVAAVVADCLGAALDVVIVRKLGVPFQPELAAGAIGEGGSRVLNRNVISAARLTPDDLANVEAHERVELQRRVDLYRDGAAMVPLAGRTVIVVDDGIATGASTRAALAVVRTHQPERVVLAIPVAPPESLASLTDDADDIVALLTPAYFRAVGHWYADFSQTTDDEVARLLTGPA